MSTTEYTTKQIEKFTQKVDKRGPDECWAWLGFRRPSGHGRTKLNGVNSYAHRIAYELEYGPIPPGFVIRHKCNFAPCCNPAHLELGTRADNNRDRWIVGRPHNATPPYVKPTIEERFYAKVSKTPTERGCLEWTGARLPTGYGRFKGNGSPMYAHRCAWALVHGPIPAGMMIAHLCDNPRCVNVEHLFCATPAGNVRDMIDKGRNSRGETHGWAKLTEAQVFEIRSDKWASMPLGEIATHFGISRNIASSILLRKTWAHLDPTQDASYKGGQVKGEQCGNVKLTEQDVIAIRGEQFSGWRQVDIAQHFGIAAAHVSMILSRKTWKHI